MLVGVETRTTSMLPSGFSTYEPNRLVAASDRRILAGGDVEALQVAAPFAPHQDHQGVAVGAPQRTRSRRGARRSLVAEHARTYVPVEVRGQIARLGARRQVHHPQVLLGVGAHRLVQRTEKRHALAVATDGNRAQRTALNARDFLGLAAGCGNRVHGVLRRFVIRLQRSVGNEIDFRAVRRPCGFLLRKIRPTVSCLGLALSSAPPPAGMLQMWLGWVKSRYPAPLKR